MKATPKTDFDTVESFDGIADYKTAQNQYEINCTVCGKSFFADKATADAVNRRIEHDTDNLFLCGDCQNELEEELIEES